MHAREPKRMAPPGVGGAIAAAVLFGASTPFAKLLLGQLPPVLLAGLLYLGAGVGLTLLYFSRRRNSAESPLTRADLPWLAGATFFGGVLGPVLLMLGLTSSPASTASLLLNLEGVFTALLAWFAFRENFDRRIAVGMFLRVYLAQAEGSGRAEPASCREGAQRTARCSGPMGPAASCSRCFTPGCRRPSTTPRPPTSRRRRLALGCTARAARSSNSPDCKRSILWPAVSSCRASWPTGSTFALAWAMDVPTRQAFTIALVAPDEGSAAAGFTTSARAFAQAVAPAFSGFALASAATGLPFFLAGGLKIAYYLALYCRFRNVPLPDAERPSA